VNFLNKVTKHAFGCVEVCDHTVFEGPDRNNVAWRATNHFFGFHTHGQNSPGVVIDGNNGRLVQDDSMTADVHQRVCGSEVNGHISADK
jgi:polyferredoxin